MRISILTLFPEMFAGPFDYSIIKRAKEKNLVEIVFITIRDFGIGKHQVVDDTAYSGGIGMVMRVDVVHAAIRFAKEKFAKEKRKEDAIETTVLLSAAGKKFTQQTAKSYAFFDHLILICGHYEGIDERIKKYIDHEISIGDFVLTGGEIPAMLVADATIRLITGVLKEGATDNESFSIEHNLLEYPQYTKPAEYDGQTVPPILLSGNHQAIAVWKKDAAGKKTKENRPDI